MPDAIIPLLPTGPATFLVRPLPDFLADHTLLADDKPGRLREHGLRWVQVVRSLWGWQGATFALRYQASPEWPTLLVTVQGIAARSEDQTLLEIDLQTRLRDFGIPVRALSAAPPALNACGYEVRQRVDSSVWQSEGKRTITPGQPTSLRNLDWLPDQHRTNPPVVFPWRGPGGTFQLPMRALLSLGERAEFTVYLSPVRLTAPETLFLRAAAEAEAKGRATASVHGDSQISFADPAAAFASRLYLSQYRRLANPFLVCVRCAAETAAAAKSLTSTIEAVVLEPPLEVATDPEDARLPPGANVFGPRSGGFGAPFATGGDPLARLPYLADAAGAATVFRLPVSVNGGVPGIETRQRVPDFHPGRRIFTLPEDHIDLGRFEDGGHATMPLEDLTKHALVTGFTGSGKTVTVLRLLHQLWVRHQVPFLVLESAKQEYRGLFEVPAFADDLRVYTLGNETAVPFRLNPFELLPGVRVEGHVGRLQVCFEGAIPPVGPSSSVIAESLVRVYANCGWTITDTCPETEPRRKFPTLGQFVKAVEDVIEERNYGDEVKQNVTAAIVGRMRPLLLGSKGRMLDCQNSEPAPADLFGRPTVLEMNDLNVDDKALVVMFLLTLLREYREREFGRTDGAAGKLAHVTVVEEAHNVLAAVRSSGTGEGAGADTRYKAVEAFCALLTEVRALDEGLIVADQSPEKLAADAMRNTNLQIAHQLRDAHDRDAVANAMIMTDEQRNFIGKLGAGQAAMFRTGLERATFITVPPYYPLDDLPPPDRHADGTGFNRNMSLDDLVRRMEALEPAIKERRRPERPFGGCDLCPVKSTCPHGDRMWAEFTESGQGPIDVWKLGRGVQAKATNEELWDFIARACRVGAARLGTVDEAERIGMEFCYLVHLWHNKYGLVPKAPLRTVHIHNLNHHLKRTCHD